MGKSKVENISGKNLDVTMNKKTNGNNRKKIRTNVQNISKSTVNLTIYLDNDDESSIERLRLKFINIYKSKIYITVYNPSNSLKFEPTQVRYVNIYHSVIDITVENGHKEDDNEGKQRKKHKKSKKDSYRSQSDSSY